MKEIFENILSNIESSTDTVLCTIVKKTGSGPRDAGAQMLVGSSGLLCGTVGGGSVEQEAIAFAKQCLQKQQSGIHEYLLYINQTEDIGMICGGNVLIHFQYIPYRDTAWKELGGNVLSALKDKQSGTLLLFGDGSVARLLPQAVRPDDTAGYPVPLPCGKRAVLFGAGHVSFALAPILNYIGFRVTVFDDRPDFANRSRFPDAETILIGNYGSIEKVLDIQPDDFIVVLTSGHSHDYDVEKQILKKKVAYLGVIGSKKKTAAINEKLLADGFDQKAIDSVHTPIGLPIKAVTPEEIAISIAAEMILVRAQSEPGFGSGKCPM